MNHLSRSQASALVIRRSSSAADPAKRKAGTYERLLREIDTERRHEEEEERKHEEEEAAERKRIEELEKEVRALQASKQQLATQTNENQTQLTAVQKTINSQLGPFGFGDRINAFLGQQTSRWSETLPPGTTTLIKREPTIRYWSFKSIRCLESPIGFSFTVLSAR